MICGNNRSVADHMTAPTNFDFLESRLSTDEECLVTLDRVTPPDSPESRLNGQEVLI